VLHWPTANPTELFDEKPAGRVDVIADGSVLADAAAWNRTGLIANDRSDDGRAVTLETVRRATEQRLTPGAGCGGGGEVNRPVDYRECRFGPVSKWRVERKVGCVEFGEECLAVGVGRHRPRP